MDNLSCEEVLESIAEMTLIHQNMLMKLDVAVSMLIDAQKQQSELINELTKGHPVIHLIKHK